MFSSIFQCVTFVLSFVHDSILSFEITSQLFLFVSRVFLRISNEFINVFVFIAVCFDKTKSKRLVGYCLPSLTACSLNDSLVVSVIIKASYQFTFYFLLFCHKIFLFSFATTFFFIRFLILTKDISYFCLFIGFLGETEAVRDKKLPINRKLLGQ